MNFIMIGLLLRQVLDRLCVPLNMYLVCSRVLNNEDNKSYEQHIFHLNISFHVYFTCCFAISVTVTVN